MSQELYNKIINHSVGGDPIYPNLPFRAHTKAPSVRKIKFDSLPSISSNQNKKQILDHESVKHIKHIEKTVSSNLLETFTKETISPEIKETISGEIKTIIIFKPLIPPFKTGVPLIQHYIKTNIPAELPVKQSISQKINPISTLKVNQDLSGVKKIPNETMGYKTVKIAMKVRKLRAEGDIRPTKEIIKDVIKMYNKGEL